MANKRVFVAFAKEDITTKILFTGQAKNENVPYEFVDMSVKEPWDSQWKTRCRTKIKGCDGMIALVSPNTKKAEGELWEINCAIEEGVKVMGIYIKNASFLDAPTPLIGKCKAWTWDNVKEFIESL